MRVENLPLAGAKLIFPKVFQDERGFFLETYRESAYKEAGVDSIFVQDNHSRSHRGALRGLHYQSFPGQAKLVRVVSGEIFDVIVDIRLGSSTFGKWRGVNLRADEHAQLFIPVGFAHGFCVKSDVADVLYRVSSYYDPEAECTIAWNDPDLGIEWPEKTPVLSARDCGASSFCEYMKRMRS